MRGLALIALLLWLAPTASSATVVAFRTPSGNIGCVYTSQGPSLRCDIRTGLKPRPARPRGCDLDWGDSYELGRTARARVTCHGDTAILPRARVLRYGSSWSRSGFACNSLAIGLICRNRSNHGFFMSKQRSFRF